MTKRAASYLRSAWTRSGLARQVAEQLMNHDALGAHARDELGISAAGTARPIQAALTSAAHLRHRRSVASIGVSNSIACMVFSYKYLFKIACFLLNYLNLKITKLLQQDIA